MSMTKGTPESSQIIFLERQLLSAQMKAEEEQRRRSEAEAELRREREPLRWTTDPPTVPGWYWWREPCSVVWNVCELYEGTAPRERPPLFVRHVGRVDHLPTFVYIFGAEGPGGRRLEWAGPIPEPSDD